MNDKSCYTNCRCGSKKAVCKGCAISVPGGQRKHQKQAAKKYYRKKSQDDHLKRSKMSMFSVSCMIHCGDCLPLSRLYVALIIS